MAQKLEQLQSQNLSQSLNPQQMLLVKLLEYPVTDLRQRVEDELLENAALEEDGASGDDSSDVTDTHDEESNLSSSDVEDDRADYFSDDDVPEYMLRRQSNAEEQRERVVVEGSSFYESLSEQISEYDLSEHERELVEYIIGSLDDDGLLRKSLETLSSELEIYHDVLTNIEEMSHALSVLQSFEPRGIGARSLKECLHLQLSDVESLKKPYHREALKVVDKYFDDFTRKRWDEIQRKLGIECDDEFEKVLHVLLHLNPRPGNSLNDNKGVGAEQVVPDFVVTRNEDDSYNIKLNEADVPQLNVSRAFKESILQYSKGEKLTREQKEAYIYARQKVDSAQNFIKALEQRRKTLLRVMETIVDLQSDFFEEGDEQQLHPMVLKDIAERIGSSISTISRVTGSKYVETDFGIYSLKFFFTTSYASSDGEELAARKVKIAIKNLIDVEDKQKPLTDELIMQKLKEQGMTIARRTVAKYREQLGLPVARLRK